MVNSVLPVIEQLLVLQDRDTRAAQLRAELTRIPTEIAGVEARVQQGSEQLETLRAQLKHLEAERKKLEVEAESRRSQVLKYRSQLFQIKSNTEYQALLKEIAKLEQEVRETEDRELELMEQAAAAQPELQQEQTLVKEVTAKSASEKSDLEKRTAAIEQELTQLKTEREKLAQQIEGSALARYERLLRSKGDVAVVPVQNGNCGGCHLHIPPQVAHDARFGADLTSCDYCGRILYCPPD